MIENISNVSVWSWNNVMGIGYFTTIIVFMGYDSMDTRLESDCH